MSSRLCPFCMRMAEGDTCPHCGKTINYAGSPAHLPAGYVVSGKHPYVLGAALGQGGFGITYIALDMVTSARVAIKEYYPTYCSTRTDGATVTAYSNQEEVYAKGKERFLDEARTLKSLSDLPNIVNVLDFFEANNTAYLVMEFLEGSSLKEHAAKHGKFPAQKFLQQIKPLMEDIHRMHERGVIHRDIAPDNIILMPDGRMKLIDFGAARSYVGDKSMTVVVKKGFAPVEQYMSKGSTASTDVYAIAATIYYCVTGVVPPDSAERQYDNVPLKPPSELGADITRSQERALCKALEILQKDRTQSTHDFLSQLHTKAPSTPKPVTSKKPKNTKQVSKPSTSQKKFPIIAVVSIIMVLLCSFFLFSKSTDDSDTHAAIQDSNEEASSVIPNANTSTPEAAEEIPHADKITLWTYPIGGWGDQETVDALMAKFETDTGIKVTVDYLNYADGDDKVNTAIECSAAPDLIMESPERLVANWGAKGKMVNIADLYDATDKAEINAAALAACFADDATAYEYPLVMTAHCMAINKTVFEAAGAMEHINADTHTWKSVADFEAAIAKVYAHTGATVGAVYCAGQGGDQGTRALVTNLKGGSFTNPDHTAYTWASEENIAALKALYDNPAFDYTYIVGGDEITLFYHGRLNVAFCWNIAQQQNPHNANAGAEKTANGDDIMFMAFPSNTTPKLCGGVWGFGIFDNGDSGRIEAAKIFIKYFCDSTATTDAVRAANYFAVRETAEGTDLSNIWADNPVMDAYKVLMPMLGDYYQVTDNWSEARTAWWNMLQEVGASDGSIEGIRRIVQNAVSSITNYQ